LIAHFAFPFTLAGSSFAVVEQDSSDEIVQCVEVLLSTTRGQRVELPEYGIGDPLFKDSVDVQDALNAIADWEPRASVVINTNIDSVDELVRHVRVQVEEGDQA